MLKIADIRGWIASLGIAADNRVYIGKLDNKQQKSIGVYGRGGSGPPYIALGGLEYTTYDTKFLFWCIGIVTKKKVKLQRMIFLRKLETCPVWT